MHRVRKILLGAVWAELLGGAPLAAQEAVAFEVGIDHIILRVDRLAPGIEQFTRLTGVAPRRGGQHPGRGTENALVSLGVDRYLELLAPVSTGPDSVGARDRTRLVLAGWALHTRAIEQLIARVEAAGFPLFGPAPGSRRTPEGALLEWRTATLTDRTLGLAPFFIQWSAGTAHPSGTSPAGCRLASLELVHPDTTRLSALFRAAGYHPVLRIGTIPGMHAVLDCPRGKVSLTS